MLVSKCNSVRIYSTGAWRVVLRRVVFGWEFFLSSRHVGGWIPDVFGFRVVCVCVLDVQV